MAKKKSKEKSERRVFYGLEDLVENGPADLDFSQMTVTTHDGFKVVVTDGMTGPQLLAARKAARAAKVKP